MSSGWVRGPICGIDNCRSRLWQTVDGRKVCQYGHVKEGDIEIGEDEDAFFASQGRRKLNIPRSQRGSSVASDHGKLNFFGIEGQAIGFQSLQLLLRKQVYWLIKNQGLPKELERVVKSLWMILVNGTDFGISSFGTDTVRSTPRGTPKVSPRGTPRGSQRSSPFTSADEEDTAAPTTNKDQDDIGPANDNSDNDNENNNVGSNRKKLYGKKSKPYLKTAEFIHTTALCYLGCVILRIPVYGYDFIRWIERQEFPYMRAYSYIPDEMWKKLPQHFTHIFQPENFPDLGQFHNAVRTLSQMYFAAGVKIPQPAIQPLIFKIIQDLFLPPEIYVASQRLAESLEITLELPQLRSTFIYKLEIPEVKVFCIIIITVKLCYGLDEWVRIPLDDITPASQIIDWDLWSDVVRKVWLEDETFFNIDDRDVSFWDELKVKRYLDWVETRLLARQPINPQYKRIMDWFPLGEHGKDGMPKHPRRRRGSSFSSSSSSLLLSSPTLNAGPHEIAEIMRIVHSTTAPFVFDGNRDDIKVKGILLTSGARYQSYPNATEPPNVVKIMYETAARLCGVSSNIIHSLVRILEKRCDKLDWEAMDNLTERQDIKEGR